MIKKKICLLGAFAVGKTSLVRQFIENIFSLRYHTTLGVKIDKKSICVDGENIDLIIWDLAGEDDFMSVKMSYLRGAAAYLVVVDGTRKDTLDTALDLIERAEREMGKLPYIILVNKSDLAAKWQIVSSDLTILETRGNKVFNTSAKTSENVEIAFEEIARMALSK